MTDPFDGIFPDPEHYAAMRSVRAFWFGKYREQDPGLTVDLGSTPRHAEWPGDGPNPRALTIVPDPTRPLSHPDLITSCAPALTSRDRRYAQQLKPHPCKDCGTIVEPRHKRCRVCAKVEKSRARKASYCAGKATAGVQPTTS